MWLQPSVTSPRSVSPRSVPIRGAVVPSSKSSPRAGRGFSTFAYSIDGKVDSYEAAERERNGRARASHSGSTVSSPRDVLQSRPVFAARAVPHAPKQAGAFQRFRYSVNPFEDKEDITREESHRVKARALGGPFKSGGNARNEKQALQRRGPELRSRLSVTLRGDWPSFLKIIEDERGVMHALFDAHRLDTERRADLRMYMKRLINTDNAAIEFGVQRDPTHWGSVESLPPAMPSEHAEVEGDDGVKSVVVYAFRPPWVANDVRQRLQALQRPPSAQHQQQPALMP